jgi:hypothetical protein
VRVDVRKREQRSALEALWALGALEPKKKVKAARRRVGLWWKGCRKKPPRAAVFCHLTTGTETYTVKYGGVIQKCLPPREILPYFGARSCLTPLSSYINYMVL